MVKALAIKELRETAGIAVLALVVYAAVTSSLAGLPLFTMFSGQPTEVPFAGRTFDKIFGLLSGLFATALGFRQSAWESGRGTFLFLLHRPMSRDRIFLVKMATGLALYFACALVPIVLYAAWAAVPGNHPSPFAWSMTASAWSLYLTVPLVYFGAFLSGVRPARWYGTRLLPWAAAALLLAVLASEPLSLMASSALALAAYGLMLAAIHYVTATRDYA